jgi:cadmium resistance protein CadD (predicted permease)
MANLLSVLSVAVVVFVATNVDDIFLISALFADVHLRPRAVVLGQLVGIAVLVAASAIAAAAALAVPAGYTALLGLIPLVLGLAQLRLLWRGEEPSDDELRDGERKIEQKLHSQVLSVAAITIANGGDNLSVYIPLFAREPAAIPLHAAVFAVLTGVWCWLGYRLVHNRVVGEHVRRYGHIALPFVLIGLGLWLLWGARALLG